MSAIAEKKLLYAIIERAVLDLQGKDANDIMGRYHMRRADAWLFYWRSGDEGEPFTFPWCCQELDVCPSELTRKLRKIVDSGAKFNPYSKLGMKRLGDAIEHQPESATEREAYF